MPGGPSRTCPDNVPRGSGAGDRPHVKVPIPDAIQAEGLAKGSLAPSLRKAVGTVTVSVAMSEKPIAATVPDGATSLKSLPSRSQQRSQTGDVVAQQDQMINLASTSAPDPLVGPPKRPMWWR